MTGHGFTTRVRSLVSRIVSRTAGRLIVGLLPTVFPLICAGCKREQDVKWLDTNAVATRPAVRFGYSLAPELRERQPEVTAFLRHFLETCLAGDYESYRKMVASGVEPESKARFDRVLRAIESLDVEQIEPVESASLPKPAYLVTGRVKFRPEEEARRPRRPGPHRIGLLIIRENNEWRTALAPRELQPDAQSPGAEPTTTGPSYPWDTPP